MKTAWHVMTVRLRPEEHAELDARRRAAGYRGFSGYVRDAVLAQRPPKAAAPLVNVQEYGKLGALANNLNQLARHLNAGNILDDSGELAGILEATQRELRRLRHALLETDGQGCSERSER